MHIQEESEVAHSPTQQPKPLPSIILLKFTGIQYIHNLMYISKHLNTWSGLVHENTVPGPQMSISILLLPHKANGLKELMENIKMFNTSSVPFILVIIMYFPPL